MVRGGGGVVVLIPNIIDSSAMQDVHGKAN